MRAAVYCLGKSRRSPWSLRPGSLRRVRLALRAGRGAFAHAKGGGDPIRPDFTVSGMIGSLEPPSQRRTAVHNLCYIRAPNTTSARLLVRRKGAERATARSPLRRPPPNHGFVEFLAGGGSNSVRISPCSLTSADDVSPGGNVRYNRVGVLDCHFDHSSIRRAVDAATIG